MRRLTSLLLMVFVFVAVASFAADKRLSDRQMDAITAGQPAAENGSGAVVVGDSTATITKDNGITIDHTAGTDAKALNFIVSTGSYVGVGTNIWYGEKSSNSPEWVSQSNRISQDLGNGAYLADYHGGLDIHLGGLVIVVDDLGYLQGELGTALGVDFLGVGVRGLDVREGAEFPAASAEFIVADDSDLKYSSTNSTTIDNGAMTGLKALNVVSAANSLVGIGLNLAVTSQDLQTLHFINQRNVVTQRY